MYKKPKKIKPCDVKVTPEHYEKMLWCHRLGIKTYPVWKKKKLYVEIENPLAKNRITMSPKDYTQCEMQQEMWDLYIKLYDKYKKSD